MKLEAVVWDLKMKNMAEPAQHGQRRCMISTHITLSELILCKTFSEAQWVYPYAVEVGHLNSV
jgi:hypothetical protein